MQEKAAVLFISGQSNAHAHAQFLPEQDRITTPLKNVFALDRDPNQSFAITDVVWSGFTTQGKNLGETQDHTASFAYFFAKQWQSAIDGGAKLPDLYIVQISIGSQGILNGMWNRDKEKVMQPGTLDTVNISLFPWAQQVNRLAMENLRRNGKNPVVIGWHWIGSEQDMQNQTYLQEDFQQRYDFFFDAILASIGQACPVFLYKINCKRFAARRELPLEKVDSVNQELQRQVARLPDAQMVDAAQCPLWDPEKEHNGIYAADDAHYLAQTQEWFAQTFYAQVMRCRIVGI